MKILKINKKKNEVFHQILSSKDLLDRPDLTQYNNEEYYVIFKNDKVVPTHEAIISISRICYDQKEWKDTQHIPKDFIFDGNTILFSGIATKKEFQNQGYGKSLLNERFKIASNKDVFIYTDVRKSSSLLNHYIENGLKIIDEDDTYYYLYGKTKD